MWGFSTRRLYSYLFAFFAVRLRPGHAVGSQRAEAGPTVGARLVTPSMGFPDRKVPRRCICDHRGVVSIPVSRG